MCHAGIDRGFLFHISGLLAQEFLSWTWLSSEKREVRQKFTFETIQNNTKARGHAKFKALRSSVS
jgi:hypothetical protein